MKGTKLNFIKFALTIAILFHFAQGQQNQVSPKLDFSETEDKHNSTVPVIKQGRSDGTSSNREKETDGGTDKNDGKSGPKIHGVRVTVDTGDAHKSKESKESVEITDLGKNKKRVGIHTDITFEITAGADVHGNKTSREQDDDEKEDASVPIFKGRGGSGSHKNRKPSQWNPNFSTERRSYDQSGRGRYPDYYPEYYPSNVPVYVGSSGGGGGGGGGNSGGSSIYRQSDGWNSYIPRSSYWTTERSHADAYRPNDVAATQGSVAWKPCYCLTNDNDYRKRRDSNHQHHHTEQPHVVVRPTSSVIQIVDSKLERTFSRK